MVGLAGVTPKQARGVCFRGEIGAGDWCVEASCDRPAGLFGDLHGYEQDWQDSPDFGAAWCGGASGEDYGASDRDQAGSHPPYGPGYGPSGDGTQDLDSHDRCANHGPSRFGSSSHRPRAPARRHGLGPSYHRRSSGWSDHRPSCRLIGWRG